MAIYNPDDDFMILNYFAYYTGSTPIHPPPANEDQLEWLVSTTPSGPLCNPKHIFVPT